MDRPCASWFPAHHMVMWVVEFASWLCELQLYIVLVTKSPSGRQGHWIMTEAPEASEATSRVLVKLGCEGERCQQRAGDRLSVTLSTCRYLGKTPCWQPSWQRVRSRAPSSPRGTVRSCTVRRPSRDVLHCSQLLTRQQSPPMASPFSGFHCGLDKGPPSSAWTWCVPTHLQPAPARHSAHSWVHTTTEATYLPGGRELSGGTERSKSAAFFVRSVDVPFVSFLHWGSGDSFSLPMAPLCHPSS